MKRFSLLTILALLLVLPVFAEPVDVTSASETARSFFRNDPVPARRLAAIRQVRLYDAPLARAAEAEPAFYVFNREGGGFVIVAGDDACKPILAYSYENSFGNPGDMPDGLRDWLADYEAQVAQLRAEGAKPAPARYGADMAAYKTEVLHKTPYWHQGSPFNRLCPKDNGKDTWVGCVPLAMGLVMNFFGHPDHGTGTLPSYDYSYYGMAHHVDGVELGYPYEWDKFRNVDFNKKYTEEQADAVALFLRDVSIAGKAGFTVDGTDSDFERIVPAVIEHFGYDPNVRHLSRSYFTDDEWMDLLKGDLQEHPLIYAAGTEDGGHAFVVDGYNNKNYLHINWGWGPDYIGYYALSAFIPSPGENYKYGHTTVLGLVPDKGQGGSPEEYLYLCSAQGSDGRYYRGLSSSGSLERGKTFSVNIAWYFNGGITEFNGKIALALVDGEDNILEFISEVSDIEQLEPRGGRGVFGISCKFNSYPCGTDKVKVVYRSDKWPEGVWKLPLVDREGGVVSELSVPADPTTLAQASALSFSKADGKINMKTKDRVDWVLKDSGGKTVGQGKSDEFSFMISTSSLPSGSYELTLTRGEEKQVISLKL